MATATLLLPQRSRLAGTALPAELGRALARAERRQAEPGEVAQLRRHFDLPGSAWPVAALTRQYDVGDAGQDTWVRADPALVAPDMQGARLMGYGAQLDLDEEDSAALLPALAGLAAEAGLELHAPVPSRWYLRVPAGLELPEFADPGDVLGSDLFDHLPAGPAGRRWRALLTETQVVLHQHPWNRERAERGKVAVNSLWFWGGGPQPASVSSRHSRVRSNDPLLMALARASGADGEGGSDVAALVDLRQLRSPAQFAQDVMQPLLAELRRGELQQLLLDFQDGLQFVLQPGQRWRLWRKPLDRLEA